MNKTPTGIYIILGVFFLYVLSIVIVDPFDYFNNDIVNRDLKSRISYPLDQRLTKVIRYNRNPSSNLLLGDSRINSLNTAYIAEVSGVSYFNFGYGACTVPEIIDEFWYATEVKMPENVFIGMDFLMYNQYNNKNLFNDAVRSSSLFYYIFNSVNFRVLYYLIKDKFSDVEINLGKPDASKQEYWEEMLLFVPEVYYKLYKYPEEYYQELLKIKAFCEENDINLYFFIPPTHIDVHEKRLEYSLIEEYQKFKEDIRSLGTVYDYDIDCERTRDKNRFRDPFHFDEEFGKIIINEVFSN